MIKEIFLRPELQQQPPILIDIGASGSLHPKWRKIAKYSWCIAFDADQRDFQFVESEKGNFKKLFVYNCIVSDVEAEVSRFYLTKSPYCSSLLEPNNEKLEPYVNSQLFEVEKEISLKTLSLNTVLNDLGIDRIDWFKTDSQGIDLRLFKSLSNEIQKQILVAEFEPGIIDAYKGEDKLYQILEYFQLQNYWLSDIDIKGVPRISYDLLKKYFSSDFTFKLARESMQKTPCWAEMTFFSELNNEDTFGIREYLLAWVFATIEKKHSFALVVAKKGIERFKEIIFEEMEKKSIKFMKRDILKLKFLPSVIAKIKSSVF
ncbi:MAG: FkbM family methyltransferase [Ignavibacteriaceae bacterium]